MTDVWSDAQEKLLDVSPDEAKELARDGFATGEAAQLKAREAGWEGKLAAGATALSNSLLFGIPKLATQTISPQTAKYAQELQERHPYVTLGSELAGGATSLAALPGGAAARIGGAAFAGGNEALSKDVGAGDWDQAVKSGDYSKVGEHWLQAVGLSGLFAGATEAGAKVLAKAAPPLQKAVTRKLTEWSNRGYFQKIVDAGDIASEDLRAAFNLDKAAAELPKPPLVSDLKSPAPKIPRPYEGMTVQPSEPEVPFAQVELLPEQPAAQRIEKARTLGRADSAEATRLAQEPFRPEDAHALRSELDRSAFEAAQSQPWEGEGDIARGFRAERDAVPPGMTEQQIARSQAAQRALDAPDFQLDDAFNRSFNLGEPNASGVIEPSAPVLTDLPRSPAELPEPNVRIPKPGKLAKLKGYPTPQRPIIDKALPQPALPKLAPQPNEFIAPGDRFEFAPGKEPKLPISRLAVQAGASALGFKTGHPVAGLLLGERALETGLFQVGRGLQQRAQLAAINRAAAINTIGNFVTRPAVQMGGKVVKMLVQGSAGKVSSSYVGGDVDAEYNAILQGVTATQANPALIMDHYQPRYGPLSPDGKLVGQIAQQATKGINYIAAGLPTQQRPATLLDPPYDPPRSVKLKVIQRYTGVNDPHGALVAPTYESVAAVQAVHPQTLEEIRSQLAEKLLDEKVRLGLTNAQRRDISIVMGIPTNYLQSQEGIAKLAAIGQSAQAAQQQPAGGAPQPNPAGKGVNLGGLASSYARIVAPPSQQIAIEQDLGE